MRKWCHSKRIIGVATGVCAFILAASFGWAQEAKKEFTWREQAEERFALSDAVARLEKDKLIFVDEGLKQPFEAYVETDLPFFITSDAVLHTYHVLLEESLARMEVGNALFLRKTMEDALVKLPEVIAKLKGNDDLKQKGARRAAIALAVPARLLGADVSTGDEEVDKAIAAEVAKILEGQAIGFPSWLVTPSDDLLAIDYASFKPAGFYAKTELLGNYFRAVKWLQMIPFRSQLDEEWLAFWLLSETIFPALRVDADWVKKYELSGRLERLGGLFGAADNLGVHKFSYSYGELDMGGNKKKAVAEVIELREQLPERLVEMGMGEPLVNDLLRVDSASSNKQGQAEFRVLPGIRLPDSVLFQSTVGTGKFLKRKHPSGLQIAAWVGSSQARSELKQQGFINVLKKGEELETLLSRDPSLYGTWMGCMNILVNGLDPDAPDVFRGELWQRKTCETVLTSWAQMRHSTVLQAKLNVSFMGETRVPPGFIEPNPDFFTSLAALVSGTGEIFESGRVFEVSGEIQAIELRDLAKILASDAANMKLKKKMPPDPFGSDNIDPTIAEYYDGFDAWFKLGNAVDILIGFEEWNDEWYKLLAPNRIRIMASTLRQLANDIESGKRAPLDDGFARKLRQRWHDLSFLCQRLATLCHKQMRGLDFSSKENNFLKGIGKRLGHLEFYDGNSWLAPRDDAPKAAEIFHNPTLGKRLHVAVGRPMAIYILYPWKGQERLCRGAVMSYYEFLSPNPVSDKEWKNKLDAKNAPSRPDWAVPALLGADPSLPGAAADPFK